MAAAADQQQGEVVKFHPYSEVFELLVGDEMQSLVDDIKQNGLAEKIVRYEGKILDGRNRFLACAAAKVPPKYREFKGDDDAALAFVVSANAKRRHQTFEQRALSAARVATLQKGRPAKNTARAVFTQEQAAQQFNVSVDSVQRAADVLDHGSKALQQAVSSGEVPLKKAAEVTDQPKSEQLAAATKPAEKPAKPKKRTKAAKAPKPDDDERGRPDDEEAASLARAEAEYAESIEKVMAADDRLDALNKECKRQSAEIATLKVSRDGYLNGKAAIEKLLRKEQAKSAQLSKRLDAANAKIEKLEERIAIMKEGGR